MRRAPHIPIKQINCRGSFMGEGVVAGYDLFVGNNVTICKGTTIGNGVVVGHGAVIEEDCIIGNNVRIQALVYLARGTVVEDNVFIGPMACTTNDRRILSHGRGEFVPDAPVIEFAARIGARALLMPGVVVGRNALVGAGAIVDSNVPSGQVVYGPKAETKGLVPEEEILIG